MAMGRASSLIEFRRAFVWLLCAVLLPSVALVAFGVVAVANERAAVERRLADEYGSKLHALERELQDRLEAAGQAAADARMRAAPPRDPLVVELLPDPPDDSLGLQPSLRRAATLPPGEHFFTAPGGAEQGLFLIVALPGQRAGAARIDLAGLARQVEALPTALGPREHARFRLVPLRDGDVGLPSLKRIVAEVAPSSSRATPVARLPLGSPLEGLALAAELPGDDPVATAAIRNRTLYIVLLVLLYTSIGVGFGLTLRELYRGAQLSQLKTDFVANISHELRTPLTSVRLFAETLQSGRARGEEVQECLDLLAQESERLSTLVEKLLDWSRLESGRRAFEKMPVEVPALFDQVGVAFRAQQLGATYEVEVEPGLPRVEVDSNAMAQVVLNLLHNAIKYTPETGRRIRLRAARSGREVAIEVHDNGPGVRPKDRKRIFERFYRADDLLSRRTEGTGLGLAIAERIVEGHGGRIELESRLGHGSTFRVLLPALG